MPLTGKKHALIASAAATGSGQTRELTTANSKAELTL
jgi:hypothetical protein